MHYTNSISSEDRVLEFATVMLLPPYLKAGLPRWRRYSPFSAMPLSGMEMLGTSKVLVYDVINPICMASG